LIYEPLYQYNILKPGVTYPWLATSYSFGAGDKSLVITLRKGVTWSDGKPFISADVAFTFELLKKYPALNSDGIDFATVSAEGSYKVKMTFAQPNFGQLYYILNQTPILPEHIWSTVGNPTKYLDKNPIGTGPYVLKSFTPQYMVLTKNPHYWQPGLPKVDTITYPSVGSADAQNAATNAGVDTWSGATEPNVKELFVGKSPYNHAWYPPTGVNALFPNLTVYPLNEPAVRQAISLAINRQHVTTLGEYGYEPPVKTLTGLILPNQQSLLAPQYQKAVPTHNVAEAKRLLAQAGLKAGPNGMLVGKNGSPINLTLVDPSSYTDYMSDLQVIASDLKAVGIGTSIQGTSVATWTSDMETGEFDLTVYWSNSGPSPFYVYNGWLNDSLTAPIGKNASADFERWYDPASQHYLAEYERGTTDAQRTAAIQGLEGVLVKDLPVIPLVYSVDWGNYRTNVVTGFPTPSDSYTSPGISTPNVELVVLHLHPVKG
jgi:peptide/nickel transport system substrate-binding protein